MVQSPILSNGVAKRSPRLSASTSSKPASASATKLCEVINGNGTAALSEVLDLMDLAAGRTAFRHIGGITVTVSFEDLVLHAPIPRGSMIRASARVIAVGKTSVLLQVVADAEDLETHKFSQCVSAYATFVAISKSPERQANISVPGVDVDGDAAAQEGQRTKTRLAMTRKAFADIGALKAEAITVNADICGERNNEVLSAEDSVVEFHKQYLPRHENFAGMVFGGDLLETMERAATYCARRFVRGAEEVSCIAIKYFNFVKPIKPMNLWCLRGRIAAVVGAVMYVEVVASVDINHNGIDVVKANEGLFAVLLTDRNGSPLDCPVSLVMEGADEDSLRAHRKAALWIAHEQVDSGVLMAK